MGSLRENEPEYTQKQGLGLPCWYKNIINSCGNAILV